MKSPQNNKSIILYNVEQNLNIPNASTQIKIEAVRMGAKKDKTRPILVKFSSHDDRENVRGKKQENVIWNANGYISEQFPKEVNSGT